MNNRLATGFTAGALGAFILVIIMYVMQLAGLGEPGFVGMYRSVFGSNSPLDHTIAAILFIISGGVWGLIYVFLIKNPSVMSGFFFGLLPTLWLWIVVNAVIGKPLFNGFSAKGIILPLIFNMVIWGIFVGWYTSRRYRLA